MTPPPEHPAILFAHPAYQLLARFEARATGLRGVEARTREALRARAGEAEVIVVSGLWDGAILAEAPRLRLVQSVSAGVDQYDRAAFARAGVRLASAGGVNANAVSDHAMALVLSLTRLLPQARDDQARHRWRGMIGNIAEREDELPGKTMLVVGLGRIGGRVARLARAFGMTVIGLRRDPAAGGEADEVRAVSELHAMLPRADVVVLTLPLTPGTTGLIGREALAKMKPGARLVNVARGRVVDEAALIDALRRGTIAGAALDCVAEEPLPPGSPLWDLPNVVITPHSAGETRAYEDNLLDLLLENLGRLRRGEALVNEVV